MMPVCHLDVSRREGSRKVQSTVSQAEVSLTRQGAVCAQDLGSAPLRPALASVNAAKVRDLMSGALCCRDFELSAMCWRARLEFRVHYLHASSSIAQRTCTPLSQAPSAADAIQCCSEDMVIDCRDSGTARGVRLHSDGTAHLAGFSFTARRTLVHHRSST